MADCQVRRALDASCVTNFVDGNSCRPGPYISKYTLDALRNNNNNERNRCGDDWRRFSGLGWEYRRKSSRQQRKLYARFDPLIFQCMPLHFVL